MDPLPTDPLARERATQRKVNAYHRLFKTKAGKLILDDLKQAFGSDRPAFIPMAAGGYDPLWAAVRDGQRQVILHIETQLSIPFQGDGNIEKPQVKVIV